VLPSAARAMPSPMPSEEARIQIAIEAYTAALELKDRNQRLEGFARAEQLFRQIAEGDAENPPIRNPALYVNLGNGALQAERIGPAIAAYRQALALEPRQKQAAQNLAYARSLLPEWIRRESSSRLIDTLFFWRAALSGGQILVVAAGFFLVAALVFALGYFLGQPVVRLFAFVPLLGWLVVLTSVLLDQGNPREREVVVVQETVVRAADSENAAMRLSQPLPSGAEVELMQQRGRWSEIQLPGGRSGWILSSAIAKPAG